MTAIKRNYNVDLMRTLAIFLMVIFHFCYDLRYFGWVTWHIPDGDGWKQFRYVILTLFFLCVGIGLFYSHGKQINWQSLLKRLAQIAIGAGLITAMSLVMFPKNWVFFGVLHFIFVASLCALLFVPYPRLSLITGISIIVLGFSGVLGRRWPITYFTDSLPNYTVDYVAFFPWLGVVLLGISLAHSNSLNRDIFKLNNVKNNTIMQRLAWPGKHSLIIYLVHQPLLFAILAPIHWWLG
ncbi:heparan-alpha-glucosaminide N-acetyltransferase [Colwellia echini]|uniref:DUF1624 domain-containing protein n=1 Tax=Colwellia echini TaxID=1982103 RepID=A0ABY3MUW0_9GAMM|nr:heparan-alpha-glucosaminide N-acetyltransferase [Colwellia echini]TYK64980.1 DUF1624 domain-containing protein [Colwellia echini]